MKAHWYFVIGGFAIVLLVLGMLGLEAYHETQDVRRFCDGQWGRDGYKLVVEWKIPIKNSQFYCKTPEILAKESGCAGDVSCRMK